ncbi:MAG TPA: DNA methylase [Candidatus Gallimonas intestinigallinarum]|uniref:DNA methylase n=1 Tax=Candidatus Gallimonas intestinigallinarum TaxID=2838604 RepID=A0A9D2DXI2_9FIRM|nr:DNA methylase [Candidatus Gallimonas intestinigallinarum]
MQRTYIAIDLKSFYASVECMARGLDPLTTNLVVADARRTEKTICLAVSPSLKAYGIGGRARLFEVVERVRAVNRTRKKAAPNRVFTGNSADAVALNSDPSLAVDYIVAPPRMAFYMEVSARIYQIYLRHAAPEDIHVYSIDEVFIDATAYLAAAGLTAWAFVKNILREILAETGITATAGIGTNLYLCKVAMDVGAKHIAADKDGARIAELDEMSYRRTLWEHTPITDFWRVGRGYAEKLAAHGLYTMGDIARCSLGGAQDYYNEDLLYQLFGVNAELLIDHAWGWEPCTIADIKAYRQQSNSIGAGQVLQSPYPFEKAKLVAGEMAEGLALSLVEKNLVCDQIVMTVGYDVENPAYKGEYSVDRYGRKIPKHAHGTYNLGRQTSSAKLIAGAVAALFDRIVDESLFVRRMYITAAHVVPESEMRAPAARQLSLFDDRATEERRRAEEEALEKEKRRQQAVLEIKNKYGKNAILKGKNFEEGATAKERNEQIGGHRA